MPNPVVTSATDLTSVSVDQTIDVTVTDPMGIDYTVVVAFSFANGAHEVVHDGSSFSAMYSFSRRATVADGFSYALRRVGGWPGSPTLHVYS